MSLGTAAWANLVLTERIAEGNRNEVWRGRLADIEVAVRRSRRAAGSSEWASLGWELDLIEHLDASGFVVPTIIRSDDGRRHVDGVVVQRWLSGREPSTEHDWHLVAATLQQLHRSTREISQRPGCSAVADLTRSSVSVDADMAALPADVADDVLGVFETVAGLSTSVIHGDPHGSNIRIGDDGTVGLLDFDESRVDVAWHDLSNLGVRVLDEKTHLAAMRLSDAWETVNAWVLEPAYARRRLEGLRNSPEAT